MSDILPDFASIRDQDQAIGLLKTLLKTGTIPHALLFTGIEGVGKRMAATAFAMACLCKSDRREDKNPHYQFSNVSHPKHARHPCTQCRNCRRVISGNHPNVVRIDPQGEYIRIGQVRSLCAALTMKPYEEGLRVVIIANAHRMNREASNALLKVLEEPPDRTILILTGLAVSELLPTIVSRCQRFQFNPLKSMTIAEALMEKNGLTRIQAEIIASLANGSMSKALQMAEQNFIALRNWLLTACGFRTAKSKAIPIWQALALSEILFKQKQYLDDHLEIIKTWLRDVLIYSHSQDRIVNQDLLEDIKTRSQLESKDSLLRKIDAVSHAQKILRANGNLRLTLEVMALQLAR